MKNLVPSILVLCLAIPVPARAQEEFEPERIVGLMKRVAHYRMNYDDIRNLWNKDNQWGVKDQGNNWDVGVFMTGMTALYDVSRDPAILDFQTRWAETFGYLPYSGDITTTSADHMCCEQAYCELYLLNPTPENAFKIRGTRDNLAHLFRAGAPTGRKVWDWVDALYMAAPIVARYCEATQDYAMLDSLDTWFWDVSDYLYNPEYRLWARDGQWIYDVNGRVDYGKSRNGKPVFWARGNGWVTAAICRILESMPADHPSRGRYVKRLQEQCSAILAQQGGNKDWPGMWTTSLLDHENFPAAEASGTAFFCYAFAWGVRHDVLDSATYLPSAKAAWSDLCRNVAPDGKLLRTQGVGWMPTDVPELSDTANSYPYAEGAFMLAGRELVRLHENETGTKYLPSSK